MEYSGFIAVAVIVAFGVFVASRVKKARDAKKKRPPYSGPSYPIEEPRDPNKHLD